MNDYATNDLKLTLEWVNGIRVRYGDQPLREMPRGVPLAACDCPVARALNGPDGNVESAHVAGTRASIRERGNGPYERTWFVLPESVLAFIRGFDAGEYPELALSGIIAGSPWHDGDDE